ncbi:S8 family serine peptidase [Alphaproteobacteria bacterium]|nr:S8 family serine peptidase [Alphaproteobacteria bacterium]
MLLSRTFYRLFIAFIASLMLVAILAPIGQAQTLSSEYFLETLRKKGKGKGKNRGKRRGPKKRNPIDTDDGTTTDPAVPTFQSWMHADVQAAWDAGFTGQNTNLIIVDDFNSRSRFRANLGTGRTRKTHGGWTAAQAGMIATSATLNQVDWGASSFDLAADKLNVANASYGMMTAVLPDAADLSLGGVSDTLTTAAQSGLAVVTKAAGNDGVAVLNASAEGYYDVLNHSLLGSQSGLYVGALSSNGSTDSLASMASYSNFAGQDTSVQERFLVVGVEGNKTGLYGTSFAAPVVAGYASILGSKFTGTTATAISQQLLDTARTDTISGYDAAIHGQGEASLSRALAPTTIQ